MEARRKKMKMFLHKVGIGQEGEEGKRGFPQQNRGELGPAEQDGVPYFLILLSTDLIARAL